jgi:ketosteroid isomerase-like protein
MTNAELLARESIRHTMASYTMAGDRLRAEDFIAVFTEDAILETEGVPAQDAFRHAGRQAIHDWINRWRQRPREDAKPVHQASFVRHHLATSLIELVDGETANARTYWTAYTDIGPDHCGCYLDLFRKAGDRWLIAHRRIRLDWRSHDSLMFTAVARTS